MVGISAFPQGLPTSIFWVRGWTVLPCPTEKMNVAK